ncbi:MAG TPA: hypothetical protein VGM78_00805 [Ilumatobacteraceae bacterium]
MMRRLGLPLAIAGLALSAVACSGGAGGPQAVAVPEVFDLNVDAAANIAAVDPNRGAVVAADQLRELLEQDMSWHGITLVQVMRAARANDSSLQAWIAQLVDNTTTITADVGLVYGPVGARAFNQQWAQHTQFLVDYAVAVGRHDSKGADEAKEDLDDYEADSASFFATATGGHVTAAAAQQLLTTHVDDMLAMIDAAQAGDDAGSLRLATSDGAYLSTIADGLSGAIAAQQPQAFPGSTATPAAVLCTIVTAKTTGYLETLLITGNSTSADAHAAAASLASAANETTDAVLGFAGDLPRASVATQAAAAKASLVAAQKFAVAHAPTT